MTYTLHTRTSPNWGPGRVRLPAQHLILHWWGTPAGQSPWNIIAHLCNPAPGGDPNAAVSAHEVIWPGNVAQLLDHSARSWANGNAWANDNAITIECDPNNIAATLPTIVARAADLVRQGVLTADFELSGHRDWRATSCPGDYYARLPEIRKNITAALTEGDDTMQPVQYTDRYTGHSAEAHAEAVLGWILNNQHETLAALDRLNGAVDKLTEAVAANPTVTYTDRYTGEQQKATETTVEGWQLNNSHEILQRLDALTGVVTQLVEVKR